MTQDRFASLAEAYGADLRRWPGAERTAAEAFAATDAETAERLLAAERALDAALDRWTSTAPSAGLQGRVVAAAPLAAAAGRLWRWLTGVGLGVALAGAGAAGVVVGFTETPHSLVRAISGERAPEPTDDVSGLVAPPAVDQDGA
jgi:hypothetical protein